MLKQLIYIICLSSFSWSLCSQKLMKKSWGAGVVDRIEIVSDWVYDIQLETGSQQTVEIYTEVAGEHYENVVLDVSEKEGTLSITPGYSPYFKVPNDKLAAHKVISIEIRVMLPPGKEVFVSSQLSSVTATGSYKKLYAGLDNGNCILVDFEGDAQLYTRHGNIHVLAKTGVAGTAESRRGKVKNGLSSRGIFTVTAESVNGDVILMPSQ